MILAVLVAVAVLVSVGGLGGGVGCGGVGGTCCLAGRYRNDMLSMC